MNLGDATAFLPVALVLVTCDMTLMSKEGPEGTRTPPAMHQAGRQGEASRIDGAGKRSSLSWRALMEQTGL